MNSTLSKLLRLLFALFLAASLMACGIIDDDDDDDDNNGGNDQGQTIVDIAAADDRFTTLVAALQAAGLDDDLAGDGPFTVFAPTDDAFDLLPEGTVDSLLEPANQNVLIDILTFHVFAGRVTAADAIALAGTAATMLNGSDLRIDVIDNAVILSLNGNRQATVTITDIEASNGIIHVIDAVLDPEDATSSIVQTAVDNGNFDTLVAALQAAGLDDDLEGPGPFTVFAPTDTAFSALPAGTVETLLEPANQADLIDLLQYHVFDGSVLAVDAVALDGANVTMLSGDDMSIDVVGETVVLNQGGNREAMVVITDVLASNGVIHVIDVVLDPEDAGLDNIVNTAVNNGNFTTLVAALQAAELDDDLTGPGPFTVFAPTDDAFDLLPAGTVETLLEPANQATLIDILTYHVFSGRVLAADAIALDGSSVAMLNGDDMSIDVVGDAVVLNQGGNREATVVITDVLATNGVIHVIDAVLDPGDAP